MVLKKDFKAPKLFYLFDEHRIENLIENKLLIEESLERKLVVTEEILNQQLAIFYQQYGGEEKLKEMLAMQNLKIEDILVN